MSGDTTTLTVRSGGRGLALASASVAAVAVLILYHGTYGSIVAKWRDDTTFSHGFLIVPIALWLGWRRWPDVGRCDLRPSGLGFVLAITAAVTWVVARLTGVLVLEQAAAVAMVVAVVPATLGMQVARVLAFPLAFLFFAVPAGRGVVPELMQFTAAIATSALKVSGVPIWHDEMVIGIPQGQFIIARACGGLGYSIAGMALGAIYAYLSYTRWWKRCIAVLAFLVVPILANGLRVYITIGVSYLTDMRYGPGNEHVTFGRVFFLLIMFAMFWVGRRWQDPPPARAQPRAVAIAAGGPCVLAAVTLLSILAVAPSRAQALLERANRAARSAGEMALPAADTPSWMGLDARAWRPLYHGATREMSHAYRDSAGRRVDVFVGVYGLGASAGSEMISSDNMIFSREGEFLYASEPRSLDVSSAGALRFIEQHGAAAGDRRLVWYWYVVGERRAIRPVIVKALEALGFLSGDYSPELIVAMSTADTDDADSVLREFVTAHARCVVGNFRAVACR